MADGKLYLGNRRYSSWSLRGWLMVRLAGLDVEEIIIPLAGGNTPAVRAVSPNQMVPYLEHGDARIWESLAIAEYCAEITPSLWPADRLARGNARSIAAEMHAGFRGLRQAMPMNLGRSFPGHGQTPAALADIARITAIWAATQAAFGGGPYLFGDTLTAADAMFAPVVTRFLTYGVELPAAAAAYCAAIRAHGLVAKWYDLAAKEPESWQLPKYESIA
jgi:glutathione S-transferase